MPRGYTLALVLYGAVAVGCTADQVSDTPTIAVAQHAIVNGEVESGFSGAGALVGLFPDGHFTGSFCSAVLIAQNWVLTAAHCLDGIRDRAKHRNALFEASIVHFMSGPKARKRDQGVLFRAARLIPHPRYSDLGASHHYDIALIELAESAEGVDVYPPFANALENYIGQTVQYVGFGANVVGGGEGGGIKRSGTFVLDSLTPTVYVTRQPDGGVCFGDSGGPGLLEVDGVWYTAGINSTTFGPERCTGFSSQVRVDAFIGWINASMGHTVACDEPNGGCACPDACGPDGVCDNGRCCQAGCLDLLACVNTCGEPPCQLHCMLNACPEDNYLLERLGVCMDEKCPDRNPDCVENQCRRSMKGCREGLDAIRGDGLCRGLYECSQDCVMPFCQDGCFYDASLDAQAEYKTLVTCAQRECTGPTTQAEDFDQCMLHRCRDRLLSCMPSDDCRLPGGDCEAGTACVVESWGGRYCRSTRGLALGSECELNAVTCLDGHACLDDGAGPQCQSLCTTGADCPRLGATCERFTGPGVPFPVGICRGGCADDDGDGACNDSDCMPNDGNVHPGGEEDCQTAADEDCDGEIDENCIACIDHDGDGVCVEEDCDDHDRRRAPGIVETCGNARDDDCDSIIDEGCAPALEDLDALELAGQVAESIAGQTAVRIDVVRADSPASSGCTCAVNTSSATPLWWLLVLLWLRTRVLVIVRCTQRWSILVLCFGIMSCSPHDPAHGPIGDSKTTADEADADVFDLVGGGFTNAPGESGPALDLGERDGMGGHRGTSGGVSASANGEQDVMVDIGGTAEEAFPTTIDEIQQGRVPLGTEVLIEDVIVSTPQTTAGFYVSDGTATAFSGIWIAVKLPADEDFELELGALVTVRGSVTEAFSHGADSGSTVKTRTQVEVSVAAHLRRTGTGRPPRPIDVTEAELLVPDVAELYEGVLIRLYDVSVSDVIRHDLVILNGLIHMGALFHAFDFAWQGIGTKFDSMTGILHYSEDGFIIMPRQASDLQRSEIELNECLPIGGVVLCTVPASFDLAVAQCAGLGGRLVMPDSPQTNQDLGALVAQWYSDPFWIALTDRVVEGEWQWIDGRALDYGAWASNEPNNAGGREHCAHSNWQDIGAWNDLPCERPNAFVCEFRDGAPQCVMNEECGEPPHKCVDGRCVLE